MSKKQKINLQPIPNWLHWLGRQMIPNIGTVVTVMVLLWSTNAIAAPWNTPLQQDPGPSITTINYQGRLADSSGTPITNSGLSMAFALYTQETGGNPIWSKVYSNVPVSDGLFSVRLGPLDVNLINGDLWLGVQAGTDPEMTPREKLAAVPYAMVAQKALAVPNGAIGTGQIAANAITDDKINPNIQLSNLIKSGMVSSGTAAGSAYREMSVLFPVPFQTAPKVVATSDDLAGVNQKTFINIRSITPNGFLIRWYKRDGSNFAASDPSVNAYWIAVKQ